MTYGEKNNVDTFIIENEIYKSRCEGIFVIEGGYSWIKKNEIVKRNDGIDVLFSQPEINNNKINQNKRTGVIVGGESNPQIHDNEISNNGVVGVNIRDNSSGSIPPSQKTTLRHLLQDILELDKQKKEKRKNGSFRPF